jgi:hypothetical protein
MKWKQLESWRPRDTFVEAPTWAVDRYNGTEHLLGPAPYRRYRRFKTRERALLAANKQNRLDGLPEVV